MKSKTLSCNLTLLRKDIFRFAPLWGVYLIGGLLVMLSVLSGNHTGRSAMSLAETIGPFSVINLIYACLVAQMLFGDLFNTRLCYAQHSLPMRRETWFLTHVVSGILYSFVPHLIATLFFLPMLGQFWFVAWAWLLAMVLQYLFFFGLAVLCVFLTGNRFAMTAVYAIINFASLIAHWFVTTIYEPLLYGVMISEDPFYWASPVVKMASNSDFLLFDDRWVQNHYYNEEYIVTYEGFGEGWGYLAICAGLGLLLLGVALLLYRKRKLECAGDFIAVKPLEPVFAVVFTLCAGCGFALFADIFGMDSNLIFFIVGLVIGWFGGQMLLQRTVKVFRGKVFLKLAILAVAIAASIGLTAWDPIGITRYVPETQQVQKVEVVQGRYLSAHSYRSSVEATDPLTIDAVRQVHEQLLEQRGNPTADRSRYFSIRYTLKNGVQIVRSYLVYSGTPAWDMLAALHSTPEQILGFSDWDSWSGTVQYIDINGWTMKNLIALYSDKHEGSAYLYDAEAIQRELLEAIWQDCLLGYMHSEYFEDKYTEYMIHAEWEGETYMEYRNWSITESMTNCLKWMEKYKDLLNAI